MLVLFMFQSLVSYSLGEFFKLRNSTNWFSVSKLSAAPSRSGRTGAPPGAKEGRTSTYHHLHEFVGRFLVFKLGSYIIVDRHPPLCSLSTHETCTVPTHLLPSLPACGDHGTCRLVLAEQRLNARTTRMTPNNLVFVCFPSSRGSL